jgi:hypothetical protein
MILLISVNQPTELPLNRTSPICSLIQDTGHDASYKLVLVRVTSFLVNGVLTAECIQALRDLLDVVGLDIADISHEIGNLYLSAHRPANVYSSQCCTHITPTVRDLLVDVVLSQDLVH